MPNLCSVNSAYDEGGIDELLLHSPFDVHEPLLHERVFLQLCDHHRVIKL